MWTKRTVAAVTIGGLAVAGATGVAVAQGNGDQVRDREQQVQTWVDEGAISEQDAEAFARVQEQFQADREERRAEREAQREEHRQELADAAGVTPQHTRWDNSSENLRYLI